MPDQHYDILIIGAGIVGLSTAMHVLRLLPDSRLLVVEKEENIAQHQSGHNSGVIHSGIYYKPGSLKARMCVEGAAAMVKFCRDNGIAHEICGKVIVAASEAELPRLEELHRRGQANGIAGLRFLDPVGLRDLEPHARGIRALHVPGTGITDYAAVSHKYAEIVTSNGGELYTSAKVVDIVQRRDEMLVETSRGAFAAKYLINC